MTTPNAPTMDYQTAPDLSDAALTLDALQLFQRFQQKADREHVDALLDEQVSQHLKRCELAILYAAGNNCYWAELPRHPLRDIDLWTCDRLAKAGFEIKHHREGDTVSVQNCMARDQTLQTVEIRTYFTASWLALKPRDLKKTAREWRRRAKLEAAARKAHHPVPLSRIDGNNLVAGNAVWAAILDQRYLVEVQRILGSDMLYIFTLDGGCVHAEPTTVAYGAAFGADTGDVAAWSERAQSVVDSFSKNAEKMSPTATTPPGRKDTGSPSRRQTPRSALKRKR